MIDFVFTIDYEIYGNGTGGLRELIYDPAEKLRELFKGHGARFVNFVEASELQKIEAHGTDRAIELVTKQIQELYRDGHEVGLHLHPQWSNARFERGEWVLDPSEYNLCTLTRPRIAEIVEGSLDFLRHVVGSRDFTPLSFRAGNWLFQPTETAASVLAENGIKIDSSVFKGGLQRSHRLDYRPARRNGYWWSFRRNVNEPDPSGPWMEVPIYTQMVPFWKMPTSKRMGFKNQFGISSRSTRQKLIRSLDFMRLRYPLKLDFCRMGLDELTSMMDKIIREDRKEPESFRPIVSIGHTKDLTDFETIDAFLSYLKTNQIAISTFTDIYPKLLSAAGIHQ
jgi:hypothetical protein